MQPRPAAGRIRPKLSSIPRQHTEAADYLELHKLALEKSRLQDELVRMENRKAVITERLAIIARQMQPAQPSPSPPLEPLPSQHRGVFEMLNLKY